MREGVPLAQFTTLRVGGPAERFVEVGDVKGLAESLAEADAGNTPVLVLGEGSNVVISDDGFPGTVVRLALTGRRAKADGDDVLVSLGAGEPWAPFVAQCAAEGLSGVECMAGVPGLVGATPVQNVGAYGQEVSETVQKVAVWDRRKAELREMSPQQCKFSYRSSVFKRNDRFVVTNVTFRLRRSDRSGPIAYAELADRLGCRLGGQASLEEVVAAVLSLRRAKGMVIDAADPDTRSAGSFFVNPVLQGEDLARFRRLAPDAPGFPSRGAEKIPAGWLVEHAGFARGYRKAGAAISNKHALALTALDGGTAADVLALAREVRDGVRSAFGVTLEPEPVLVGLHL